MAPPAVAILILAGTGLLSSASPTTASLASASPISAASAWEQLGGDIASLVAGDESGKAVAIDADGSRVAVGAPEHDDSRGAVRIYDRDGSSWTQVGNTIDGETAGDRSGTAVSLSSDGSRVAIGAPLHDGTCCTDSGHVRVYEWSSSTSSWDKMGNDIDGEAGGDESGWAVSLSADGSRVAIGAPFNDGKGANSGHVRVYDWNGSSWVRVGSDIDGETAHDRSGYRAAVSISGDGARVAIGASHNGGNGEDSGHVRVYEYDGVSNDADGINGWTQKGSDIDGETAGDLSGRSVSLDEDGSRVAIGAVYNDGVNGADSGHVRVYEFSSGSWSQLGSDVDGEAAGDEMGWAVSLSADGSRFAVGAALNDGNGSNSGQVRIYEWDADSSSWIQSGTNIDGDAANDVLGRAVSLSADGSRVVVGAPGNDGSAMDAGHVRVYAKDLAASPGACSPSTTEYTSGSTDYTVVTFNDVGTCNWTVPDAVTSVDVLAVGGGGGGGAWVGGGGGGGGVTFSPNVTVTPSGTVPVIVGAGGAGASKAYDSLTSGANGASSSFGSASPVSALGGGVGASWYAQAAGAGGSVASGGGGSQNSGTYAGGTGDASSGGSAGILDQPHPTGGGGGAGGNGQDGTGVAHTSGAAGAGGVGAVSDITGTSIYYGGGGGGAIHGTWTEQGLLAQVTTPGAGGTGGGGAGGKPPGAGVDGEDGTDGLGGGGGGGATHAHIDSSGGDGGSGVVIVRYTLAMATCSPSTTSYTSGSTIYTVLAFKDVGTCSWAIPSGVSTFDWLVVGGGGGGGSWHGAGGGAGGMRSSEGLNVAIDTSFTIQVGAGGDGAPIPGETIRGSSGGASSITGSSTGLLVSVLGGGGGGTGRRLSGTGYDGADGGSGGGSQADLYDGAPAGSILPGSGKPGEGNDGANGSGGGVDHPGTAWVGGGGGGYGAAASGAGEESGNVTAGNGGDGGAIPWITASVATELGVGEVVGSDVYFAGGGAGAGDEAVSYTLGTGGLGGGGDGRLYADGAGGDGAASTGGGGAGSSLSTADATHAGGAGGSGVVVLRYQQTARSITYDANGGSGTTPNDTEGVLPLTVASGGDLTSGSLAFLRWNTSSDGSGTDHAPGSSYSTDADLALFAIYERDPSLSWTPTTAVTATGSPLTPDATPSYSGGGALSYSVTDAGTTGCAVDASTGELSFTATGSCAVRASVAATGDYVTDSVDVTFVISPTPQTIAFTSAVPERPLPGGTYTPEAIATSGLTPTFTISTGATSVCTLSSGVVTFLAAGTCTISATQTGDSRYAAARAQIQTITVGALNQTINVSVPDDVGHGTPGFSLDTEATSGLDVSVTSTDTDICTVTGLVVTPVDIGDCELTITQPGNTRYAAASPVTITFRIRAAVPTAPTIVSVSAGNANATIAFTAPGFTGGVDLAAYTITATPTTGDPISDTTCTTSPCTITGLTNGTDYTLTITANNTAGSGPVSTASPTVTPATRATAVTNLAATPGDGAIGITWNPPTDFGGGTFTRYELRIAPDGESMPTAATATMTDASAGSHTMTGLDNGTAYNVEVVTITSANQTPITGNTARLSTVPVSTPGAPTEVTVNVISPRVIRLTWAEPEHNGGAAVTNYTVTLTGGDGNSVECGTITIVDGTRTADCTSDPLELSTAYTITIAAMNRIGTGATTTVTHSTPTFTAPTTPPVINTDDDDDTDCPCVFDTDGNPVPVDVERTAPGVTPGSVTIGDGTSTITLGGDNNDGDGLFWVDADGQLVVLPPAEVPFSGSGGLPGTTVTVFIDGVAVGTATVDDDGTWTVIVDLPVGTTGPIDATIVWVDENGDQQTLTTPIEIYTPVTTPPVVDPDIDECPCVFDADGSPIPIDVERTEPGVTPGSVTIDGGAITLGGTTTNPDQATTWIDADGQLVAQTPGTIPLGGSDALPGTTVTVFIDGVAAGTATVNSDGTWTLDLDIPAGTNGQVTITIVWTDENGEQRILATPITIIPTGDAATAPRAPTTGTQLTPDPDTAIAIGPNGELLDSTRTVDPSGDSVIVTVGETGIRVSPAENGRIDSSGRLILTPPSRVRVTGDNMLPGATATIWIMSDPQQLGTVIVAADGTIDVTFAIPTGIDPGDHTIQIDTANAAGHALSVALGLIISTAALPVTGVSTDTPLAWLTLVLALGALTTLVGSGRRCRQHV